MLFTIRPLNLTANSIIGRFNVVSEDGVWNPCWHLKRLMKKGGPEDGEAEGVKAGKR
jgi:hypothetical protein